MKFTEVILGIGFFSFFASCGMEKVKQEEQESQVASIGFHGYDQCAKVLDGDLFNKVSNTTNLVQKDASLLRFFSMSEKDAYEQYKKIKDTSGGGNGELSVDVIGIVEIGGGGGGNSTLSESEFKENFLKAKKIFERHEEVSRFSNSASVYSSYIRDTASIKAWEKCIDQNSGAPKFRVRVVYAYGNNYYVNVYYSGGDLAASVPTVNVEVAGQTYKLGNGPHVFTVPMNPGQKSIAVNAQTSDGNTNFSDIAEIPVSEEDLKAKACTMQNLKMLAIGALNQAYFDALEEAGLVADFRSGAKTLKDFGSDTCEWFLMNHK